MLLYTILLHTNSIYCIYTILYILFYTILLIVLHIYYSIYIYIITYYYILLYTIIYYYILCIIYTYYYILFHIRILLHTNFIAYMLLYIMKYYYMLFIGAIFYPFSQFCEIDICLPSLEKQPKRAPNLFQRGVEYGKWAILLYNITHYLFYCNYPPKEKEDRPLGFDGPAHG